jgi:hypothetical protein
VTPKQQAIDRSTLVSLVLCACIAASARVPLPAYAQPEDVGSPTPAASAPLEPAGTVPAAVNLTVTGSPANPDFLDAQIRAALDRQIRPTLRPGASVAYGPIVPWPLFPLAPRTRAAVNVTVTIAADDAYATVSGVTNVIVENVATPLVKPVELFLSDDPEYVSSEGLVFRGTVIPAKPARLYYYHADAGPPRDIDVVLTASVPSRVLVVPAGGGPDLDIGTVGHQASHDLLYEEEHGEGTLLDIMPGRPLVLRHELILQGELVAGAVDLAVLSGSGVAASIVASPAGGRALPYLAGPRLPADGHNRHGTFDLRGFGELSAAYVVGGPDAAVRYGGRAVTPLNLDPTDLGRDYGDYGVVHRIGFTFTNPSNVPQYVYFYEKPLAGSVRSTFVVDGQFRELGCVRVPQPYWLMTYLLPPESTTASTVLTMPDGGSYYPIEFGVSGTLAAAYTPPPHAPDGCSPGPMTTVRRSEILLARAERR